MNVKKLLKQFRPHPDPSFKNGKVVHHSISKVRTESSYSLQEAACKYLIIYSVTSTYSGLDSFSLSPLYPSAVPPSLLVNSRFISA